MITIDAGLMRAAMACQATDDVRYYLNGILIAANGDIVATTGSLMFVGQYTVNDDDKIEKDTIIAIDGAIPLNILSVELEFRDGGSGLVHLTSAKGRMPKILSFSVVDGKFPNYERVLPGVHSKWENGIGMNASLLALIVKVYGKEATVKIIYGTSAEFWAITSETIPGATLVIMPMRIKGDNFKLLKEA